MNVVVHGIPAPQGSKKAFVNKRTGRANLVESSAGVKPWREAVKWAAREAATTGRQFVFVGDIALVVEVTFYLPRPQSHYGTGRNACTLRPSAPSHPFRKPDIDKLVRSTLDGLSEAGVWTDDARVVRVHAEKVYAEDAHPIGAAISVEQVGP